MAQTLGWTHVMNYSTKLPGVVLIWPSLSIWYGEISHILMFNFFCFTFTCLCVWLCMCICECAHMIVHMCKEGLPGLPCSILLKQSLPEHGTYQFYDARIGFWGPACLCLPSAGVTDTHFYKGVRDPNLEPCASLTESSPQFSFILLSRSTMTS